MQFCRSAVGPSSTGSDRPGALPLAGALLTLLFAGCSLNATRPRLVDDTPPQRLAQAEKPLELSLSRYPDGTPWRLSERRGKVVLLDVWATWCEPCREALPLYQDLAKEFAARGLEVYAINIDADAKVIAPFLAESKLTLPVLLDPEAAQSTVTLHVKMMPTSYLIDRTGRVRHVHEGFDDGQLSTWLSEIEALLAEPVK
jgi:thiol-disulfide isomerase/thioredoxin